MRPPKRRCESGWRDHFNGEMAERFNALVCKTSDRDESTRRRSDPRVRIPLSPPLSTVKLFERSVRQALELVFALAVPVGGFAPWAYFWFAHCGFTRPPPMTATITFITLFANRDQRHEHNIIPSRYILSINLLRL